MKVQPLQRTINWHYGLGRRLPGISNKHQPLKLYVYANRTELRAAQDYRREDTIREIEQRQVHRGGRRVYELTSTDDRQHRERKVFGQTRRCRKDAQLLRLWIVSRTSWMNRFEKTIISRQEGTETPYGGWNPRRIFLPSVIPETRCYLLKN